MWTGLFVALGAIALALLLISMRWRDRSRATRPADGGDSGFITAMPAGGSDRDEVTGGDEAAGDGGGDAGGGGDGGGGGGD